MRLGQIACLFEVSHDVSDGCGAQVAAAFSRNESRPYWFSVGDVELDDGFENLAFSIIQLGFSVRNHVQIPWAKAASSEGFIVCKAFTVKPIAAISLGVSSHSLKGKGAFDEAHNQVSRTETLEHPRQLTSE